MSYFMTFTPRNSEELFNAIEDSQPGDKITLLPIEYQGEFILGESKNPTYSIGDVQPPVTTLCGAQSVTSQGIFFGNNVCIGNGNINIRVNSSIPSSISIGNGNIIFGNGGFTQNANYFPQNSTISTKNGITIIGNRPWCVKSLAIQSYEAGLHIQGDGHSAESLYIDCGFGGVGVNIHGDDNRLKSSSIDNATHGVIIHGSRNSIRSTSLNDIKANGIIVEGGSTKTEIRSSSIEMARYSGKSLLLKHQTPGTQVRSSSFNGIVDIYGNEGAFRSSSFGRMNLFGRGNIFSSSSINAIYRSGSWNNLERSCSIEHWSNNALF